MNEVVFKSDPQWNFNFWEQGLGLSKLKTDKLEYGVLVLCEEVEMFRVVSVFSSLTVCFLAASAVSL